LTEPQANAVILQGSNLVWYLWLRCGSYKTTTTVKLKPLEVESFIPRSVKRGTRLVLRFITISCTNTFFFIFNHLYNNERGSVRSDFAYTPSPEHVHDDRDSALRAPYTYGLGTINRKRESFVTLKRDPLPFTTDPKTLT